MRFYFFGRDNAGPTGFRNVHHHNSNSGSRYPGRVASCFYRDFIFGNDKNFEKKGIGQKINICGNFGEHLCYCQRQNPNFNRRQDEGFRNCYRKKTNFRGKACFEDCCFVQ